MDVDERVLSYDEFRTGLDFREVRWMIRGRKYARRRGVLGKWRELKLAMYAEYLEGRLCEAKQRAR